MHETDNLQVFLVVNPVVSDHLNGRPLAPRFPVTLDNCRHVLRSGILDKSSVVKKSKGAVNSKRRHEPCSISGKSLGEKFNFPLAKSVQDTSCLSSPDSVELRTPLYFSRSALPSQLSFVTGNIQMNADVFDTLLTSVGGFRSCDRIRDVTGERYLLLFRFVGNGKIRIAREKAVDFYEIRALFFERSDSGTSFFRVGDGYREWPDRSRSVNNRTGCDNPRT